MGIGMGPDKGQGVIKWISELCLLQGCTSLLFSLGSGEVTNTSYGI